MNLRVFVSDGYVFFQPNGLYNDRWLRLFWEFTNAVKQFDGDVAEFGVFAGDTSFQISRYLTHMKLQKVLHMFDTFDGLPEPGQEDLAGKTAITGDLRVPRHIVEMKMHSDTAPNWEIHQGLFSIFKDIPLNICFAYIDADLYQSTKDAIEIVKRTMKQGVIVFDDYGTEWWPGVTQAVDEEFQNAEGYPRDYHAIVRVS